MKLSEFTNTQWQSFAGASGWGNGASPMYCEDRLADGRRFILVLDATGGCILVEGDDEVNDAGGRVLMRPFSTQQAARAFAREIQPPYTLDDFLAHGFAEA